MQLDDVGESDDIIRLPLPCLTIIYSVPSLLTGPRVEEAMWRSVRWLDRCIAHHKKSGRSSRQNLFAIVQGGLDPRLRELCLDEMIKRHDDVPGYAVGGLSGGEAKGLILQNITLLAYAD